MNISHYDMNTIYLAMGRRADLLKVEGSDLCLYWWCSGGSERMVVSDFKGHRSYFLPFIQKVLRRTEEFNTTYDPSGIDQEDYLNIKDAYGLGEII